jgi:membrane protein DedA with SNARE-associated domain
MLFFHDIFMLTSMSILNALNDNISIWIADFGYIGVFAATLIETIFPPIPSEIVYVAIGFMAYDNGFGFDFILSMATIGACGSTVGAIIIYLIALRVGRPAILKLGRYTFVNDSRLRSAERWFEKYGVIAVMVGRLAPGIRELISVPAGLARMNVPKFIIFTFIGSWIWSIGLTFAGYYSGQAWLAFAERSSFVIEVIALIIIIGILGVVGIRYYINHKVRIKKQTES